MIFGIRVEIVHVFAQEEFYGKPLILADRDMVESEEGSTAILESVDKEDVSFLVVGDPFGCVMAWLQLVRISLIDSYSLQSDNTYRPPPPPDYPLSKRPSIHHHPQRIDSDCPRAPWAFTLQLWTSCFDSVLHGYMEAEQLAPEDKGKSCVGIAHALFAGH